MRGPMVLLLGAVLSIAVGPAAADVIGYASVVNNGSGGQSSLFQLDFTGVLVGTGVNIHTASGNVQNVGGLAFDSTGQLWATGKALSGQGLYQINTTDNFGLATLKGSFGAVTGNATDIAFSPGGTLYAVIGINPTFKLYTLNLTNGLATQVPGSPTYGGGGNGLAFNLNPTLYMANGNTLDTTNPQTFLNGLNPTNGSIMTNPTFKFPSTNPLDPNYDVNFANWLRVNGGITDPGLRSPAMGFTADGSKLYAEILNGNPTTLVNGNPHIPDVTSALATIDIGDGTIHFLGQTLAPGSSTVDAIALFEPSAVPEPGSLALVAATAASVFGYAWRRRCASLPQHCA